MISKNQLKKLTECKNRRHLKKLKVITVFKQFREKYVVIRKFNNFNKSYDERIYSLNTGNHYSTLKLYQKFIDQIKFEYKPKLSPIFKQILNGEI